MVRKKVERMSTNLRPELEESEEEISGITSAQGRYRRDALTGLRGIDTLPRARDAYRLRFKQHLTWQEIATQLGYSDPSGPYYAVHRHLQRLDELDLMLQQLLQPQITKDEGVQ